MLANDPIDPMILATDLAPAKEFDGDAGFALTAWLVDPRGHSLGLLEFKGAETN